MTARNDANGWLPRVGRVEGVRPCNRCGLPILWVRTARRRLPFDWNDLYWTGHRDHCRMRLAGTLRNDYGSLGQHRVTPVRRVSNRLAAALVRDGRRASQGKATRRGQAGMSPWLSTVRRKPGSGLTRRAVAHGTPPPSSQVTA